MMTVAKMILLVFCLFLAFVSVSLQTTRTCSDLEQLAMNANPSYLSNCARDMACTQVTCQGSGILSGQIDSATIALAPCEVPPGIIVSLAQSGSVLVNQLITAPTTIDYDAGIATVNVNVFVNSTANSIGILINPITIATFLGTITDYLVSFTSVQLDKSSCTLTTERANTDSDLEEPTTIMADITDKETAERPNTDSDLEEPTTTMADITDKETAEEPTTTMADVTDKETGVTVTTVSSHTKASVFDTCTGLEQLAMNTNPELLSNCARDANCTQVTCEAAGIISSQLDSISMTLELCETPPGVTIEILKDGRAIINQLITTPTNITQSLDFVTVSAYVFVNSTHNTLGILVDPVIISAGSFGSGSETLISFTLVPYDTPHCNNNIIGSTLQSLTTKNTALSVILSFELFLLIVAAVFINSGQI